MFNGRIADQIPAIGVRALVELARRPRLSRAHVTD
jgi:hypothetical protein